MHGHIYGPTGLHGPIGPPDLTGPSILFRLQSKCLAICFIDPSRRWHLLTCSLMMLSIAALMGSGVSRHSPACAPSACAALHHVLASSFPTTCKQPAALAGPQTPQPLCRTQQGRQSWNISSMTCMLDLSSGRLAEQTRWSGVCCNAVGV